MRCCLLCHKKMVAGSGTFFSVPQDPSRRANWSKVCLKEFTPNSRICVDHFSKADIITAGRRFLLMPNAMPIVQQQREKITLNNIEFPCPKKNLVKSKQLSIAAASRSQFRKEKRFKTEKPVTDAAPETLESTFESQKGEFGENFVNLKKNIMPSQLQKKPIIMPPKLQRKSLIEATASKSRFCAISTQTDTSFCGLVEASELSDEFRLNCFYCSKVFPLEKWKYFAKHLRAKHFEIEEGFKNCEYISEDQGCTSVNLTPSIPTETVLEIVDINSKSDLPSLVDPLESANLSCYLKTLNTPKEEVEVKEECEPDSIEIVQVKPTEIALEYTPREIVDSLLDNMKNYPVLWQFDDDPFNEDFYEAVEDLCKIINDQWPLNINNLKMRRSINRILRFYCYLYPNDNIENIDQFTCYYDKCASFLPTSVNEIAYARCSHCYICYRNDFDLKRHLLEEYKYLQWPYKCVQCKECFIESDEYEFHKCLSHYDEIFRCEPCNKTFFRRNVYNKHVSDKHPKEAIYECDVCGKIFKNRNYLRNHKLIHGEKKQKCHLCPKSYYDRARLSLHLKLHRRQYDFMCEICGQKLFTKSKLKVHMKKHTQEKITCTICNLKLRKSSLNRHLQLLHVAYEGTIEQTLKGRHVNYRRLVKSSPFRQRRQYSEKNYDCKICKMSFENYDLVIEHNKEYHPDIPKWSCKMCIMDFSLTKNLKRHYRRKHKLEPIQAYKLVEENEDLNVVLAYDKEDLDKLTKTHSSKSKQDNVRKSVIKRPIKPDLLSNEICFVKEENNNSGMEDEIINEADNMETDDDIFVEFLE